MVRRMDWRAFYESDLQALWSLIVAPALFLVWALFAGRRRAAALGDREARFVWGWSVAFAIETIVDPLATGPASEGLGAQARQAVMLVFVLLGDFRVFVLTFRLASPGRGLGASLAEAAAWTLVVPIAAGSLDAAARWLHPELPDQALWLVYELGFVALALFLRQVVVPRRTAGGPAPLAAAHGRFLRAALLYVSAYYALWALADVLILAGSDAGWLLRALPNQLYYAWWVPFVFFAYLRARAPRRAASGLSGLPGRA
jgi:hypothetical protein